MLDVAASGRGMSSVQAGCGELETKIVIITPLAFGLDWRRWTINSLPWTLTQPFLLPLLTHLVA